MPVPISLEQALDLLGKLQNAAPEAARDRLGQVAELLQSLAEENTRLTTLLAEKSSAPPRPPEREPVIGRKASTGAVPIVSIAGLQKRMIRKTGEVAPLAPAPEKPVPGEQTAAAGGDLLNGVNESLRPPLIAIRGRTELVQAGFLGQITPEQDQWLQSIQENTGRAFALLDTIQQIIALQNGKVRLDAVNFMATDLMTEAWNRLRDKSNASQHEISLQVPPTVPLARGDFYQALIILADLLENAILYTPPGGQIRLLTDNLSSHVLFSVVDNGIGLTPHDAAHIGQPFWRGDHHKLVRQHPGTGLRLYLARALLGRMGGELIHSGQPGQGSTFSFTLPAA
jgi:signal transduction histidine kinase